jgi:glycosyltransferase involved in cell wall biosynthesis
MKILLIGEYSNVHNTLAMGLRQLGHQVTVVSNGDFWKNYPRDIDVSRKPGKLGGIMLMCRLWTLLPKLRGYDVVQLINPMFFELKAKRLFFFYRYLRRHNRRVFLGAFGMDYYWVHTCTYEKPLRYSDFNIGDKLRTDPAAVVEQRDWLGTAKERLNKMIAADCDGIITGLYEYHVCYEPSFPQKTRFIPYPIVMPSDSHEAPVASHSPLRLFIGISKGRSAYKGTDIMLKAAQDVVAKYPDKVVLTVAEGLPFAEYQQKMDASDALLDQLYGYTPAMNALLAMSKGIVVVGGGEPENYAILNETELRPIINVEPSRESVYNELEKLVLHPERITQLKHQSIEYIRRHHDYIKVAREYLAFYQ